MATISIADIELVTNTPLELYVAGEAIAAGDAFFVDGNDNAFLAINNDASKDAVAGIAIQDAAIGNYVAGIPTGATIAFSNTVVAGDTYVLAGTAGDIMLTSDLGSGDYVTVIGTCSTTNRLVLNIDVTGTVRV